MRIIAVILIFTLTACASVQTRTDRNSGVGFSNYDSVFPDG